MIDPGTATVIGAGLSAAASGTSLGVGSKMNKKNRGWYERMQNKQNDFNAEQAQIAYDRQRDLLKYQNEYDSPVNQMQRYKAAGLNPAFFAGNISATGVSSPSVNSASASSGPGQMPYYNYASSLPQGMESISNSLMQMLALQNDTELKRSEINKNNVDAAKTAGVDTEKVIQDIEESKIRVENVNADTHLKESQKQLVESQARETLYNVEKLMPVELKKKFSEIQKNLSDIRNSQTLTRAQVAKFSQDIRESISRVNLNDSTRNKIDKELDFLDANFAMDMSIKHQQFQQLKSQNQLRVESLRLTRLILSRMSCENLAT